MVAIKDLLPNPTAFELDLLERYAALPMSGQRERNMEAFLATGLPSRRVEAWKYSDLRSALLSGAPKPSSLPQDPLVGIENALELRFSNGAFSCPKSLPAGMRVLEQADAKALGGAEDTPVAALGAALSASPGTVMIEIAQSISDPFHLIFETSAPMAFSRVIFVVRKDCELTVLESHLASGGFSSHVVEYTLEDGASLTRCVYQNAATDAVQVFTGVIQLSESSKFSQGGLGFGGKLCRNETRVFHQGGGAYAQLNSAYLLGAGRHYDQTSLVRHSHAGCTTRQLCKGAVADEGRAVFQGKFFVARRAQETDAEMAHNALILENGGEINAKPELEIYADDVQCAHGNTVGSLDTEALFYMRQRGLSENDARALLTQAFVNEAFEGLPEAVAERLRSVAKDWLETQL